MSNPLISIIVPVYNAEKSIRKCVDSIISQSLLNWELLLIDDGSTDSSYMLCKEYENQDSRITVFHKANGGVSSARNFGITKSKGEWITFIDSDDWIEVDYFRNFSFDYDLSLQGYYYGDTPISYEEAIVYSNPGAEYLHRKYVYGPYCKLFKSRIIHENSILFDMKLSYGEDILFLMQYLVYSNSMSVHSFCGYHYVVCNTESLSSKKRSFEMEYLMFVKHIEYFVKIMSGSAYMRTVMRDEVFDMFYSFVYIYGKKYEDIVNDFFMRSCFKGYLYAVDKFIIMFMPSKINIYKRARNRFNIYKSAISRLFYRY